MFYCTCITDDVVNLLSWTMSLLLRARVNAALTIQLFSQLFHFINQWLFNRLIAHNSSLCTRSTGQRLIRRLRRVEMWAEKQGLELAAECHLARILQVCNFFSVQYVCCSFFHLNQYVTAHHKTSINS